MEGDSISPNITLTIIHDPPYPSPPLENPNHDITSPNMTYPEKNQQWQPEKISGL